MNKEIFTNEEFLEEVEQATKTPMDQYFGWFVKELAKRYLSERKQREDNPGVWDSAPKNATFASVHYAIESGRPYPEGDERRGAYFHYRTLPKTKAREIAENAVKDGTGFRAMINGKYVVDVIEQAILEYEKTKRD